MVPNKNDLGETQDTEFKKNNYKHAHLVQGTQRGHE